LIVDGFRVSQDRINEAFDCVKADYPEEDNEKRIRLLAIMRQKLREAAIRKKIKTFLCHF